MWRWHYVQDIYQFFSREKLNLFMKIKQQNICKQTGIPLYML